MLDVVHLFSDLGESTLWDYRKPGWASRNQFPIEVPLEDVLHITDRCCSNTLPWMEVKIKNLIKLNPKKIFSVGKKNGRTQTTPWLADDCDWFWR